jgi:hypothetical protein
MTKGASRAVVSHSSPKTGLEWGTQPLLQVKEAAIYSYRRAAMGSIRMARVAGG